MKKVTNLLALATCICAITVKAQTAEALSSTDSRNSNDLPQDFSNIVRFDFKSNGVNGLSDGGSYNAVMFWRGYGSGADMSGNYPKQIAYTANNNLWHRMGTATTSWGNWIKILDSHNFNDFAPTVTGGGASGNWNINAHSANYWGGLPANYSSEAGVANYAVVLENGIATYAGAQKFRTFLGMPSNGETLQSIMDNGSAYYKAQAQLPAFPGNPAYGVLGTFSNDANGTIHLLSAKSQSNKAGLSINNSFDFYTYNNYAGWKRFLSHNAENAFAIRLMPDGGNVGIGTNNPQGMLQIGNYASPADNKEVIIPGSYNFERVKVGQMDNNGNGSLEFVNHTSVNESYGMRLIANCDIMKGLQFQYAPAAAAYNDLVYHTSLFMGLDGNIGVGTLYPTEKFSVNGNIRSRKIKVTQEGWADFVFDSSYRLASLSEIEKYVQVNKHLPDVPSASEVKKDGLDLGENQAVLLRKIEELTLYIIEQNKQLEVQKKDNTELRDRLEAIEKMLMRFKVK